MLKKKEKEKNKLCCYNKVKSNLRRKDSEKDTCIIQGHWDKPSVATYPSMRGRRRARGASSKKGIRAESPPTFS